MSNKKDLTNLLSGNQPKKPIIKRGQGLSLSTTVEAVEEELKPPKPKLKRVNRGYKLREDLIISCKKIALDKGLHLYQVMEEALLMYVKQNREGDER